MLLDVWGFGWVWVGLGHGSIISPGSGLGWVGLGQLFGGLGWAGSMKIDPRTTLIYICTRSAGQNFVLC